MSANISHGILSCSNFYHNYDYSSYYMRDCYGGIINMILYRITHIEYQEVSK